MNDPCNDPSLAITTQRGGTQIFGLDICEEFLRINGFEKIVRPIRHLTPGTNGGLMVNCCPCSQYRIIMS